MRLAIITVILGCMTALSGCAGGSNPPSSTIAQDPRLQDVAIVYKGSPRIPHDFLEEENPLSPSGTLVTEHLKNSHIIRNPPSDFELCTNDTAQAMLWSEVSFTQFDQPYAHIVDTHLTDKYYEISRVYDQNPSVSVRQRIFLCSYLDRSNVNSRENFGHAGTLNIRPLSNTDLRYIAEYLWRYSRFNTSQHFVLLSATSGNEHLIKIISIRRGAETGDTCDRFTVYNWRYNLNLTTGELNHNIETVDQFRARHTDTKNEIC